MELVQEWGRVWEPESAKASAAKLEPALGPGLVAATVQVMGSGKGPGWGEGMGPEWGWGMELG